MYQSSINRCVFLVHWTFKPDVRVYVSEIFQIDISRILFLGNCYKTSVHDVHFGKVR